MNSNTYKNCFGIIYKITNKINNKVYIGQSCAKNKIARLDAHFNNAYNKNRGCYNSYLSTSIRKYTKDSFNKEIIDTAINQEDLDLKESYYIELYNSNDYNFGYNNKTGGNGGSKYNEESKLKISEKAKINSVGSGNPNYGKKRTTETNDKILNSFKESGHIKPLYLYRISNNTLQYIDTYYNKRKIEKDLGFSRRYILWQLKGELTHVNHHIFSYTELSEKEQEIYINNYNNRHKKKGVHKTIQNES